MAELLHKNAYGIIMVRKTTKTRQTIRVIDTSGTKNRVLRTFSCPRADDGFSPPCLSWSNLDCCGEWPFEQDRLFPAVLAGKKLYAGMKFHLKSRLYPEGRTREEAAAAFRSVCAGLDGRFASGVESFQSSDFWLDAYLCRRGRIGDFIDPDRVFLHYENLGLGLSREHQKEIRRLCGVSIPDFSTDRAPFPYRQAGTIPETVTAGLLLGYPVEATLCQIRRRFGV